jgi:hypothetical protein
MKPRTVHRARCGALMAVELIQTSGAENSEH